MMKKAEAAFAALLGAVALISSPAVGADGVDAIATPSTEFPQPQIRRSSNGKLRTILRAEVADNQMVDQLTGETQVVHTPTYAGSIPGPTLMLTPGDTLAIDFINSLPADRPNERAERFPHGFSDLNFHTHGLQVSPQGISDNIYRVMAPGTRNPIKVDIPADHPSGTFWYHPHVHAAVTFQFVAGMAGFLIVKGGPGTLDEVPEVKAAKDIVMGFQVIRADPQGNVPFVNEASTQFGTFPFFTEDPMLQGIWSTFGLDGAPGRTNFYFTTNGATNPTLHMRPGEVQRWRLLNAAVGENLLLTLHNHGLNVIAMDGITAGHTISMPPDAPLVMAPGQRYDVLVKAGAPGTYTLDSLDPSTPASVSPSGIAPDQRNARMSFDFPQPCSPANAPPGTDCKGQPSYPVPLATVVVDGDPVDMALPQGPLPAPEGMPSVDKMLSTKMDKTRHVAFELCGTVQGTQLEKPENRVPSCGYYTARYADQWGGAKFDTMEMMRDDDDKGTPNADPNMPLVGFKKEALFTADKPLFSDMIAGNYEEWTVTNRSFSDHPFHIHQQHFLVTHINGQELPVPEWHDTIIVPGAQPQPTDFSGNQPNINKIPAGSITFRIFFSPVSVGCFVMHCHILTHEDLGMMQRLDVLAAPGETTKCDAEAMVPRSAQNTSPLNWLFAMASLDSAPRGRWPTCAVP
jgi:FtsP/CotA-like multicopper oxidase with cupredoxin domain